jgi:hypothetical protein
MITLLLLIAAAVCFVIASFASLAGKFPNLNLTAMGLFFWVLSILLAGR